MNQRFILVSAQGMAALNEADFLVECLKGKYNPEELG